VARRVCCTVMGSFGDGNCGVGMTGGQACLRTMEQEHDEGEHKR